MTSPFFYRIQNSQPAPFVHPEDENWKRDSETPSSQQPKGKEYTANKEMDRGTPAGKDFLPLSLQIHRRPSASQSTSPAGLGRSSLKEAQSSRLVTHHRKICIFSYWGFNLITAGEGIIRWHGARSWLTTRLWPYCGRMGLGFSNYTSVERVVGGRGPSVSLSLRKETERFNFHLRKRSGLKGKGQNEVHGAKSRS